MDNVVFLYTPHQAREMVVGLRRSIIMKQQGSMVGDAVARRFLDLFDTLDTQLQDTPEIHPDFRKHYVRATAALCNEDYAGAYRQLRELGSAQKQYDCVIRVA